MSALHLVPDAAFDFDAAVARLRPRLHRFAARRLGDLHDAEELVQEALLRACDQQLGSEDELAAWCHVVTSRLVLDRLRVAGRSVPMADVPEGTRRNRDTAEVVVARDEARTALDALDAIAPRQAAVLWAREVEGAGYVELCRRFGMTEPAVRSLLTRARKALRQEYATRGGTLPHAGLSLLAPWAGVRGLAALHRVAVGGATRVVAPLALGLGASVLGGLLLVPGHHGAAAAAPAVAAARPQAQVEPVGVVPVRARPAVPAAAPAEAPRPVARAVVASRPTPAVRTRHTPLRALGRACAGTGDTGAGTSDCAAPARTAYVYLAVPVDAGPVSVRQVGVQTNDYDCAQFPAVPALACRSGASR